MTEEYINNYSKLISTETEDGQFWIKLIFTKKGVLEYYEVSTGSTFRVSRFFEDIISMVKIRNKQFLQNAPGKFTVIIPVAFLLN